MDTIGIMPKESTTITLLRAKKQFFQLLLLPTLPTNLDQCKPKLPSHIHYSENFGWEYQFKVPFSLECSTVVLNSKLEFSQRCPGKTTITVRVVFIKTTIFITWIWLVNSDFSKMVKLSAMLLVKSTIIWMFILINHLPKLISWIELLTDNKLTLSLHLNSESRELVKIKMIYSGLMVKFTVLKI